MVRLYLHSHIRLHGIVHKDSFMCRCKEYKREERGVEPLCTKSNSFVELVCLLCACVFVERVSSTGGGHVQALAITQASLLIYTTLHSSSSLGY
jgi:hypothetical protein